MDEIVTLAQEWRNRAEQLRNLALESVARVFEECAGELEAIVRMRDDTPVTLKQASELGGYSTDHLGRMVREGKIANLGRKGSPRIRRSDVPFKPGYTNGVDSSERPLQTPVSQDRFLTTSVLAEAIAANVKGGRYG